jgi:23S rRNA (cytosine1962-C5)-methyltransferase
VEARGGQRIAGEGDLAERFRRAMERRRPLLERADTTAFRMVNAEGDGVPGVTVDWLDGVAVASLYRPFSEEEELAIAGAAVRAFSARGVYLKRRPREARVAATARREALAPETPAAGEAIPEHEVREGGLRFRVRPAQGLAVGLYLDIRDTRAWVREQARGRAVLNCFAYTCAFSVAARAGGAASAINVDLSRRALDWGEENARLNGLPVDRRDFLSGDVFEWLPRLRKRGQRFDLVVLDPPSFSTTRGRVFAAGRDYAGLCAAAAPVVSGGGLLVACCNLEKLAEDRFQRMVEDGLRRAGRSGRLVKKLGPSAIDFPTSGGRHAGTWLKVLAFELSSPRS